MSIADRTRVLCWPRPRCAGSRRWHRPRNAATPTQRAATAHTATAPDAGGAAAVKGVLYSRGFHVTNLSGNPIKLTSVTGENSFDGRTADGSILQPGVGYQDFEMTYYFARDTFNTLNYAMLDGNGNTIATFHYLTPSAATAAPPRNSTSIPAPSAATPPAPPWT